MREPLALTQDSLGRVFIAEYGRGVRPTLYLLLNFLKLTLLAPIAPAYGCWRENGIPNIPVSLIDAGAASIGEKILCSY